MPILIGDASERAADVPARTATAVAATAKTPPTTSLRRLHAPSPAMDLSIVPPGERRVAAAILRPPAEKNQESIIAPEVGFRACWRWSRARRQGSGWPSPSGS